MGLSKNPVATIRNKEDFNTPQNSGGQTILICATESANCQIMQQILNARDSKGNRLIDVNAQDNYGYTALSIAVKTRNKTGNNEKITLQWNLMFDDRVEMKILSDNWEVVANKNYEKNLKKWEKDDPNIHKKIQELVEVIKFDPFRGPEQPERLTGNLEGLYSRRINKQNRLVYEVDGEKIILESCKGHYKQEKRRNSITRTDSTKW